MLKKFKIIIGDDFFFKSIILLFITLFGVIFEVIGLGLLIPLMTMIVNPSDFILNFNFLYIYFSFLNEEDLKLLLITLVLSTYIIKSFFFTFLAYFQSSFIANLKYTLQKRLINYYLKSDYLNFISFNTSTIIRNIKDETAELGMGLTALIIIYTDLMIAFGIIGFIIYLEGFTILVPFTILFGSGIIIYLLIKNKLFQIGHQRQNLENLSLKSVVDSIGLFPEIKVLNQIKVFASKFELFAKSKARYELLRKFILALPPVWFEFLAVVLITAVLYFSIVNNVELKSIVPKLVLYLAASIKILPSLNRIFKSLQNLRTTKPALEILYKIFNNSSVSENVNDTKKTLIFKKININNLFFKYPSNKKYIIQNLNFNFKKGDWVGIKGKSGSGKTTLVKIICGLITPEKGDFIVNNRKVYKNNPLNSNVAYVPQSIYLFDDSLLNNIVLNSKKRVYKTKLDRAIKLMKIDDLLNNDRDLNSHVGDSGVRLSGGQKQRIGIARALYANKQILILDEATNALDKKMEFQVLDNLKSQKNLTVIVISHRKETLANYCNNIIDLTN